MWKYSCVLIAVNVLFPFAFCYPYDELMEEQVDDTALVESTIREARAISPKSIHELLEPGTKQAYLHTFGDDPEEDGNVQGYLKKSKDKGDDGYKHFDSFHKKDSDKYGFEVHSEFGKLDKADVETGSKNQAVKKQKSKNDEDDAKETKRAYEVVEGPEGYSLGEGDLGESQQYADGDSGAEEEEEESSPYSSDFSEGDEDGESYEKSSSYSTSSDDGDGESEGYNEEEEEEE